MTDRLGPTEALGFSPAAAAALARELPAQFVALEVIDFAKAPWTDLTYPGQSDTRVSLQRLPSSSHTASASTASIASRRFRGFRARALAACSARCGRYRPSLSRISATRNVRRALVSWIQASLPRIRQPSRDPTAAEYLLLMFGDDVHDERDARVSWQGGACAVIRIVGDQLHGS